MHLKSANRIQGLLNSHCKCCMRYGKLYLSWRCNLHRSNPEGMKYMFLKLRKLHRRKQQEELSIRRQNMFAQNRMKWKRLRNMLRKLLSLCILQSLNFGCCSQKLKHNRCKCCMRCGMLYLSWMCSLHRSSLAGMKMWFLKLRRLHHRKQQVELNIRRQNMFALNHMK